MELIREPGEELAAVPVRTHTRAGARAAVGGGRLLPDAGLSWAAEPRVALRTAKSLNCLG